VPRLEALRAGLRDQVKRSPLGDAAAFTRDLEAAYERAFAESLQRAAR
jgi:predicted O-linked N-acetylglucosamine transferase (SPINDLY family)